MYTPFSDKLYYSAINYYPSTTNHTTYSYQYMLINIGVNVISGKKLTNWEWGNPTANSYSTLSDF